MTIALAASTLMCARTDASPAPTPSPAAAVDVTRTILPLAKEWFFRFQAGNVDRSKLDATTNGELTDAMIRHEAATLEAYGRPTAFVFLGTQQVQGLTGYVFGITFHAARVIEHIAFDADGKLAGIDFQPFVLRN